MSSVHNDAYAGAFAITSAILMTTSILYAIFPPEIAVAQDWTPVITMDFMFDYPSYLSLYEVDSGVEIRDPSEEGIVNPSFSYVLLAFPYEGQSQTYEELAHEVASMVGQGIPHAQFTRVGVNDKGHAAVQYTYDDRSGIKYAFVSGGKLHVHGFDWVIGPNESEYINIGLGIANTVYATAGVSAGGLLMGDAMVENWSTQIEESGRELDRQIQEEQIEEQICNSNPNSTCPP